MDYLEVVNWEEFQHYKDRAPPWIKLHVKIFNDYEFSCLQDASKLHLLLIWVLASQLENKIPNDPQWVKRKIGATEEVDLNVLIEKGFLCCKQTASTLQAKRSPETETETETETEEDNIPPVVPLLKITALEDIEKHPLDGHCKDWFEENCPSVCRTELREELVLYCRSKGKRYKDYWATLQTWGRRKQKEKNDGKHRTGRTQGSTQDRLAASRAQANAELGIG